MVCEANKHVCTLFPNELRLLRLCTSSTFYCSSVCPLFDFVDHFPMNYLVWVIVLYDFRGEENLQIPCKIEIWKFGFWRKSKALPNRGGEIEQFNGFS
jgi:hypothetical protein